MSATDRVIVLVDMDCFYCQVEQKLDPSLVGKPLAVVQYNAWKGGGLIAVSYEARAKGVTRHMRGDEAKAKCPDIELARVPTVRGKADLTRYRDAGKQVAEVLQSFTTLLERASVDEAYLDITDSVNQRFEMALKAEQLKNTHVVGFDNVGAFLRELDYDRHLNESNVKLAIGGAITEEIRAAVYEKTGYRCSAGVAHNKILAKLTAGLHKPNQQTVLPHESVSQLYENLSVKKIRSMGGKFGDEVMQKLDVNVMADLLKFSEKELQQYFEAKTANWLYNIARGINNDPVTVRLVSKSIGCCKRFPGRTALVTEKTVRHWTSELSIEIAERIQKDIEENNRKPKQLVISYTQRVGRQNVSNTRSNPLNTTEQEKIYQEAYEIIRKNCQRNDGGFCITFLGLNVGKFEEIKNVASITSLFKNAQKRLSNGSTSKANDVKNNSFSDEIQELNREIHKVVQENIDLNKSFRENNVVIVKKSPNDSKKQELVIPTAYMDEHNGNTSNLKVEEDADESETELEAINSSINEADTSAVSLTGKNSFFRNFLKVPRRDFNTSSALNEVTIDEINDSDMKETSVVLDNCVNDDVNIESHNLVVENVNEESKRPVIGSKSKDESQSKKPRILNMFNNTRNSLDSPATSRQSYITDDNKELCLECNKLIPVEDIVSHMDYHFAIKMVREEAHLYKQDRTVNNTRNEGVANETNVKLEKSKSISKIKANSSSNKTKSPKVNKNNNNTISNSKKRKNCQVDTIEITNFLNRAKTKGNGDMTDDNSEVCPDCCKRIKLDEIASHLDFHVAKKLHQEINSNGLGTVSAGGNRSPQKCSKVMNKTCDKNIRGSKNAGLGSIASYFKKI